MGFTIAQQAAIDESGKTLLVSAAAGSGKTFTLTKRIIQRIINDGADISRMLIVTFTRAAAGELKSRISTALSEEIAKHPENTHLQNQMLLISGAKICTIDSFFTDPVKSNFDRLGLPAKVRLADSAELEDIRNSVFSEVLEEQYEKYGIKNGAKLSDIGERNPFTDLIYLLTSSRSTNKLISILFSLYSKLITSPRGVEILLDNAKRLKESADLDFFDTPEGKIIRLDITDTLHVYEKAFENNLKRLDSDEFVKSKYYANFEENLNMCSLLAYKISTKPFSELEESFDCYAPSRLATIKKGDVTPFSEEMKEARAETHKKIGDLKKKYLSHTNDSVKENYIYMSCVNSLLYDILSAFDKKYSLAKKEAGLFEFSDMPRFLLELLGDGTTSVAKEMQEMYDEVYIDEYQDVNEIQDTIFKIIGTSRRFMVGDIKQSIYGFRDACPELFAKYKSEFPIYTDTDAVTAAGGCTIFMSENFRCDQNVIDFSNAVCSAIFKSCADSIGYTSQDDLKFSKFGLPDGYISPKVSLNIFEDDTAPDDADDDEAILDSENESEIISESDIPSEALFCAKEIQRLVKYEKKPDGSPIGYGDIAVLVRVKHHANVVAAALKKMGIEYCLSASNQLFDGNDMKSLLDLLRVIDNPEDDMALCSFLTTNAYNGSSMFSLEEIVTIRQASSTQKSLYRALTEYADTSDPLATLLCHRVADTLKIIKSMRALSRRVAADKLLKTLKTIPDFSLICESDAYTYLYDCACAYVKRSWNGLYAFLKYYKKLSESGTVTLKEASSTNAVNIMTIHQSKGLEYNTVIVYGCSRRFSTKEAKASLNYSRGLTVATKCLAESVDENGNSYISGTERSLIKDAVVKNNYYDSLFEEMRILYVALTRARERLYITATIKDSFDMFKARLLNMGFSRPSVMKQKSFIEWIISSLAISDTYSECYDLCIHSKAEDFSEGEESTVSQKPELNATESELALVDAMDMAQIISKNEKIISSIPSKVAASKATPNMLDLSIISDSTDSSDAKAAEMIKARLSLMSGSKRDFDSILSEAKAPTAAEVGTATHSFLGLCDFKNIQSTSIDCEIQRLINERFMTKESADMISRPLLKKFFESELFTDITKASEILREFEFGIYRSASEFTENPELAKILSDTKIYVQGAIDLILIFPDGTIHICDYKTDRITDFEKNNVSLFHQRLRKTHKNQLLQYKEAITQIFGKEPEKMYIYSLPLGETVEA